MKRPKLSDKTIEYLYIYAWSYLASSEEAADNLSTVVRGGEPRDKCSEELNDLCDELEAWEAYQHALKHPWPEERTTALEKKP